MRNLFFLFLFMTLGCTMLGQTRSDSAEIAKLKAQKTADSAKMEGLSRRVDTIKFKIDTLAVAKPQAGCNCYNQPVKDPFQWLLILSPLIIFLLIFFIGLSPALRNFNFNEALAESQFPKVIINNPLYIPGLVTPPLDPNLSAILGALPPTIEVSQAGPGAPPPAPLPSISRYIAFISTILTLIIALCMSSFFIYHYMRTGCPPDLSALSIVLMALGIGVAPYAFNKVSSAIAARSDE